MAAGEVAEALNVPANTLSFHFDRLRNAGLVKVERRSRSLIYSARYETMHVLLGYLTENCCRGKPAGQSSCENQPSSKISKMETAL
jgi:DNA-binding transcriptional ArsR family regulator